MGGQCRETRATSVSGKPWNAAGAGGNSGVREAVTVVWGEPWPICGGSHHEEAEAQEGQVGRRNLNQWRRRRPIRVRTKTLKTIKGG